jgi:hypothetical protein
MKTELTRTVLLACLLGIKPQDIFGRQTATLFPDFSCGKFKLRPLNGVKKHGQLVKVWNTSQVVFTVYFGFCFSERKK